ncbi:MAG: hypothetical protein ACK41O_00340 [Runella zeae]
MKIYDILALEFRRGVMKKSYYILKNGVISLNNDSLIIEDNAHKSHKLEKLIGISSVVYGVSTALKSYEEKDALNLFFGMFLAIFWTGLLIHYFFRITNRSEFLLQEIKRVELKKNRWNITITARFVVSKQQIRLIYIDSSEKNLQKLIQDLRNHDIEVIE